MSSGPVRVSYINLLPPLYTQVKLSPLVTFPLFRVHLTCGLGPERYNSAAHERALQAAL